MDSATHCCGKCAALDDGVARAEEHDADCARCECANIAVERASALEHLRVQATELKCTIHETADGANGLKAAAELAVKATARYERGVQLSTWAAKAAAATDAVLRPARPCPSGCGFAITSHPTHCCAPCERGAPEHGPKCEGKPCGSAAVERAAALKERRAHASLLRKSLEDKTWAAEELHKAHDACERSHESYLKAMQARRAADRLAPSPLDEVLEGGATSASMSARDAKLREVQKEGDEGARQLQLAMDALPGGTHGAERFKEQYEAFGNVSALASSMDTLATVQSCVALVADKRRLVEELEATLRSEATHLTRELAPLQVGLHAPISAPLRHACMRPFR